MATITVNGNTIDPEDTHLVSRDAKKSNFITIQGHHDFSIEEKRELLDLHVKIQEYVAEYTYLCRYERDDLQPIRALEFVRSANIYHAQLKATVSLKDMVKRESDQTEYEVDLILHAHPNVSASALAQYVSEAARVTTDKLEIFPNKIRLVVNQDRLDDLAALDSVNRIEEVRPRELYNDEARVTLQADAVESSLGYQGAGELICIADTGFDQGQTMDTDAIKIHPAFQGRVTRVKSVWMEDNARDMVGHGTHVCGSVLGCGVYVDSIGRKVSNKGTAPAAKLMVQALSQWSTRVNKWVLVSPAEITTLFEEAYQMGARIHSNSWGDAWNAKDGQLGYDTDATAIDKYIRGDENTPEHQDFVILISAGNDADKPNHGESQIGGNSSAKNCITVGATGSTRPNDGQRAGPTLKPCYGITDTAIFSSRGPTLGTVNSQRQPVIGRIKPDVVAPGVAILSAASRALPKDAQPRKSWGISPDLDWLFMSGTSMATPLVTGCVALIREALKDQGKPNPSAALVKALLINGAVNCTDKSGRGFDYQQGFGRVNVNSSIAMVKQATYGGFVDGGNKLDSGRYIVDGLLQTDTWQSPAIPVPSGQNTLVATLVYPDIDGALLQNDINLIVRAGEIEKHGNMGNDSGLDHTNNVERIIWQNVPGDSITVVVQPYAFLDPFSKQSQSFAVVWSFLGMN